MPIMTRFLAAAGMTNLADGIALVAWAWLASLLTRDPLFIALVPIALQMPGIFMAVPAGILADRLDRRKLVLSMDLLRAVVFANLAIVLWLVPLEEPAVRGVTQIGLFSLLVISGLVIGAAEVVRDNTAQAFMPALLDDGQFESANGILGSIELVGNSLIGPALGAFLIAAMVAAPFGVNAAAYLVAALCIYSIKGRFKAKRTKAVGSPRGEIAEAASFVWNTPLLRVFAISAALWNLNFHLMAVAIVLHVQENMQLGARAYGLIMIGGAVGGIIGGVLAGRVIRFLGKSNTAKWLLLFSIPSFAMVAIAPGPFALALGIAMVELPGVIWNSISISQRQRLPPPELLGRVNALYRLLAYTMIPVGMLVSGLSVRIAEGIMPRGDALTIPFWLATFGAMAMVLYGWPAMTRAYKTMNAP